MKVLVGMLALALVGCGSSGGDTAGGGGGYDKALCREMVRPFLESLEEIDSRLDIGLNFQEYSEQVTDTKVVYDRLAIDALEPQCLSDVAIPLEQGFNEYIDAYKVWNRCVGNTYCSNDDIQGKLQNKWAEATTKIEEAVAAL